MKKRIYTGALLLVFVVIQIANASQISGVSVGAVSSEASTYGMFAVNTINGSGLAGAIHNTLGSNMWLSAAGDLTPWIVWNLQNTYSVDTIKIWNYNGSNSVRYESFYGVKDLNIYVSTDTNPSTANWTLVLETSITRAPGEANYDTPSVVNLRGVHARLIKFQIVNNYMIWLGTGSNAEYSGLAELQFFGTAPRTPDAPTKVVVDYSNVTAPSLHRGSGFIYGFSPLSPGPGLVNPLQPQLSRTGDYPVAYAGDAFAMSKYLEQFGGKAMVFNFNRTQENLESIFAKAKKGNYNLEWDPFNEPDTSSSYASKEAFFQDWKDVYSRIRALDPTAVIVGPSPSTFIDQSGDNGNFSIKEFLEFAKDPDGNGDMSDNVLPDVLSWHSWHPLTIESEITWIKNWMTANLGTHVINKISINEYVFWSQNTNPGILVQYLSALENMEVDSASHACWSDPGGVDGCYSDGMMNCILTPDHKPRSTWWVYKAYADITGSLVKVSPSDNTQGVAGYDAQEYRSVIILGKNRGSTNLQENVVLTNLGQVSRLINSSNNIRVVVQRIPDSGLNYLEAPTTVSDSTVPVVSNQIAITLNNFGPSDAYVISLYNPDRDCSRQSDLNKDCRVDLKDFAMLAANWLKCNNPNELICE